MRVSFPPCRWLLERTASADSARPSGTFSLFFQPFHFVGTLLAMFYPPLTGSPVFLFQALLSMCQSFCLPISSLPLAPSPRGFFYRLPLPTVQHLGFCPGRISAAASLNSASLSHHPFQSQPPRQPRPSSLLAAYRSPHSSACKPCSHQPLPLLARARPCPVSLEFRCCLSPSSRSSRNQPSLSSLFSSWPLASGFSRCLLNVR